MLASDPQLAPPRQRTLRGRFFRLAGLNVLANLTVPLVALVDTGMLGHLPDVRFLAGVALAGIFFDFIYWTAGFLRMGTTATTAQAVGRQDRHGAYLALYRSLGLAVALGAILIAAQAPLRELGFAILQGETAVEAAGLDYFNARIWAAPATLANLVFLGWFLGREESGRALSLSMTANLVNILFNYLFIIRLGWAAAGAGWATVIGQVTMLALSLWFFARSGHPVGWRWSEITDRVGLGALLRFNRDLLVRTIFLAGSFFGLINASSVLGTTLLAANTILIRLVTVASYVIDGVAFATESLVGIGRGEGDTGAIRRVFRLALTSALAFVSLYLLLLLLAPEPILWLLTSHREVIDAASAHRGWLIPVLVAGAVAFALDGLFLGLTAGRDMRNGMMISALVVFTPLTAVALWKGSNHLLWLAFAAFMASRVLTLWPRLDRRMEEIRSGSESGDTPPVVAERSNPNPVDPTEPRRS